MIIETGKVFSRYDRITSINKRDSTLLNHSIDTNILSTVITKVTFDKGIVSSHLSRRNGRNVLSKA